MKPFNVIVRPEEAPKQPSSNSMLFVSDPALWVRDYIESRLPGVSNLTVDSGLKVTITVRMNTLDDGCRLLKCQIPIGRGNLNRATVESILKHLVAEVEYREGRNPKTPQERGLAVDPFVESSVQLSNGTTRQYWYRGLWVTLP